MNWTGGELRRHSGKNASRNSVAARQKQHFAKVKSQLQRGSSSSVSLSPSKRPFVPEWLEYPSSPLKKSRVHGSRQTRLDEYANVGPVVKRLERMSGRASSSKDHNSKTGSQRTSNARNASQKLKVRKQQPKNLQLGPQTDTQERPERSNPPSTTPTPDRQPQAIVLEDAFESKRLELLRRRDWVGLQPVKPVRVDYSGNKDRERIGKRRKLDELDKLRQQGAVGRFHVPSVRDDDLNGAFQTGQHDDLGSFRIRIGSDALLSHTSGLGSQPGVGLWHSQTASSESMLLDDEDYHLQDELTLLEPPPEDRGRDAATFQIPDSRFSVVLDQLRPRLVADVKEGKVRRHRNETAEAFKMDTQEHDPRWTLLNRPSISSPARLAVAYLPDAEIRGVEDDSQSCIAACGSTLAATRDEQQFRIGVGSPGRDRDEGLWRGFLRISDNTESCRTQSQDTYPIESQVYNEEPPTNHINATKVHIAETQQLRRDERMLHETAVLDVTNDAPLRQEHAEDADALWKAFVFGNSSPRSGVSTRDVAVIAELDDPEHSIQAHASCTSQEAQILESSSLLDYSGINRDEDANTTAANATSSPSVHSLEYLPSQTIAATKATSRLGDDENGSSDPLTSSDPRYADHRYGKHRGVGNTKRRILFHRPAPFDGVESRKGKGVEPVHVGRRNLAERNRGRYKKRLADQNHHIDEDDDIIEEV